MSVAPKPEVYRSYLQAPWPGMTFVLRTDRETRSLLSQVRSQIAAIDPAQPVASIRTLDDVVAESLSRPRFQAWLTTAFSAFALVLAALGIYGVTAGSLAQRTRELGIRLALGASPRAVLSTVAGEGIAVAAAGSLLGLAGAVATTRLTVTMLDPSVSLDVVACAVAAVAVSATTLVASFVPAVRAMRVEPMVALRDE
jgi:putative ABC transport system permease protein